jgi:hypothetical protein
MKLREAMPMLLAGILIPAAWGVCQDPPAQPPAQPQSQGAPPSTDKTAADKANADRRPQGKRSFHRYPPPGGQPLGSTGRMGMGRGPNPAGPPPNGRRGGGFPPMFDQLAKMSPEERNKALESDPHFNRMPPQRQAQIREHLERYSAMTPEQRRQMRDRFDIVNSMAPQNRDRIREVFPRWKQLPADRQQAMREEFHALSGMSAADRERRFNDPEFQKAFAPKEQQLLKDLASSLR